MGSEQAGQTVLIMAIGAAILVVDAILLLIATLRRSQGKQTFAATWSIADLWFGVQFGLLALIVALVPIMMVVTPRIPADELANLSTARALLAFGLPGTLLQNLIFFLVPAAFIWFRYRLPLRAIGLPPLPRRRDLVAGFLLGLIGMLLSGLVEAGVSLVADHFKTTHWVRAMQQIDHDNAVAGIERLLPHLGIGGLLLGVLAIGIAAPIGEEMLFRGFAFNTFRRRLGIVPGLLLSALVFTLPHGYGFGLVPVFVLGVFLAWVYNNTGSLWTTIVMHATNNSIQVLLAFFLPALLRG